MTAFSTFYESIIIEPATFYGIINFASWNITTGLQNKPFGNHLMD